MAAKIYIVYYSTYGHVAKLADEIQKGVSSVEGVEVKLWQVPETLSDEALAKMGAPPKREDVPVISPTELADADGLIFGFPTRFGMMPAQFKAFMDGTSELWCPQRLAGKPAALFFSTGCQGGGQETTALTAITQLVHHGMIFVPVGYTFGAGMFEMEQVKGGSPYGSGTIAGNGSRVPTELELQQAFHQGKYFAGIAKKLKFVKDGEVITEQVMEDFSRRFRGQVPDQFMSAFRALFKLDDPDVVEADRALLAHGGAATLELVTGDGADGDGQA